MCGQLVAHTGSTSLTAPSSLALTTTLTVPTFTKQRRGHFLLVGGFPQQLCCFFGSILRAEADWCEWEARVEEKEEAGLKIFEKYQFNLKMSQELN